MAGGGGGGVPDVHSSGNKTLLKSQALHKVTHHRSIITHVYMIVVAEDVNSSDRSRCMAGDETTVQYILETTVLPREPACMRELRLLTEKHERSAMASPPDEAQLLGMLVKMMGAKNTIEVGCFTGLSLLATALALPDDGKVVAIDLSREYLDLGMPAIRRAGVAHKVDFLEGDAGARLDELLAGGGDESFDFAFVDADKPSYAAYHERLLRLVRIGGAIVYDNTLWGGTVALPPDAPMSDHDRGRAAVIRDFNAMIAADERVEVCQLAVADGVTICRRVV